MGKETKILFYWGTPQWYSVLTPGSTLKGHMWLAEGTIQSAGNQTHVACLQDKYCTCCTVTPAHKTEIFLISWNNIIIPIKMGIM